MRGSRSEVSLGARVAGVGGGWLEWVHWIAGVASLALTLTGVGATIAAAIDLADGATYLVTGLAHIESTNWIAPLGDIAIGGLTIGLSFLGGRLALGTLKKSLKA